MEQTPTIQTQLIVQKVKVIVNDRALLTLLINLYDRWADEKEYEDFKDYEDAMKAHIFKTYPNFGFIKGYKRPMGMAITILGTKIRVDLKIRNGSANLKAQKL